MPLPLKQSRAAREMADLLYDFLPGSGSSGWRCHVSFRTVAEKVGVGDFWQHGSKTPMIAALIEKTLEFRRKCFEPLITEIVRAGLTYRQKQGKPIKPEDILKLNGLILEVGFKFSDLWDEGFIASLRVDGTSRAREYMEHVIQKDKLKVAERSRRSVDLENLKREFYALHQAEDRNKVGLQLEAMLNRLFYLHALAPREPFRLVGEQIDGSFVLDHEVYLLEAKWQQRPSPEADLLVFRGKIEGKSKFTRGVFVSVNGISKEAAVAITQGKQPSFFVIDGYDLTMLLEDNIDLSDFMRARQRVLAEEGKVVVPFSKLEIRS